MSASPEIIIYYSSVSGNQSIKKQQTQIRDVLGARKIPFQLIDIAADEKARDHMKSISGKAIIPQIHVNGKFKGCWEEFNDANEAGELNQFFGVSGIF